MSKGYNSSSNTSLSIGILGNDSQSRKVYRSMPLDLYTGDLINTAVEYFYNNIKIIYTNNQPQEFILDDSVVAYYSPDQIMNLICYGIQSEPIITKMNTIVSDYINLHSYFGTNTYLTIYSETLRIPKDYCLYSEDNQYSDLNKSYQILNEYVKQVYYNTGYSAFFRVKEMNDTNEYLGTIMFCTVNCINGKLYYNTSDEIKRKKSILSDILNKYNLFKDISEKNIYALRLYIPYKDHRKPSCSPIYDYLPGQVNRPGIELQQPVQFIQEMGKE